VPDDETERNCFVCGVTWFRVGLSGDAALDQAAIDARVPEGAPWAAVLQPLLVDVPDGNSKRTEPIAGTAFVYLP
jgi:hypothetical protein